MDVLLRARTSCARQSTIKLHPVLGLRPCRMRNTLNLRRAFATHRDPAPSSVLSQTLDQKQRAARGNDTIGPFTLGMVQRPLRDDADVKKWSELSVKGKVARATARSTNFTVIIFGAGLTLVLAYALASELFARNSPTVLYGEACERIKASPKVAQYLHAPLSFHNNPPSATRPRHRNRGVSSQIAIDSNGREHLLLNFYIRGSSPNAPATAAESEKPLIEQLSSLRYEEVVEWVKAKYESTVESAKSTFLYLTGRPTPARPGSVHPPHPGHEAAVGQEKREESGSWLGSLFGGLRGSLRGTASSAVQASSLGSYEEAEVHADLVKDDNGNFVWRYILLDLPHSRTRYPQRIFVERTPDVRESEAVMRWY